MNALELLVRGIAAGLIIAAPVGPVNVICAQRTLARGWRSGMISGLGSALVDTLFGAIAAFSITFVISALIRAESAIRLVGGALLVGIGIVYFFKHPKSLQAEGPESQGKELASTAALTATNPTTVLSFLVVLSAVGLARQEAWYLTLVSVGGIFAGSMLWWTILTGVIHHFRNRFNDRSILWMNRIAGIAIGGFGVVSMLTSRPHH